MNETQETTYSVLKNTLLA